MDNNNRTYVSSSESGVHHNKDAACQQYAQSICNTIDTHTMYKDLSTHFGQFGFFCKGQHSTFVDEVLSFVRVTSQGGQQQQHADDLM